MEGKAKGWRTGLDILATLAMIAASTAVIWAIIATRDARQPSTGSPPPARPTKAIPQALISLGDSPILGNAGAPVAIIEFSDYECPFCAQFHQKTFPSIRASHVDTGKVLFAFRHLPLERHQSAFAAAEAAVCAFRQGRFWKFHDELFSSPMTLDPSSLRAKAAKIGADSKAFESCLSSDGKARIEQDIALAREIGITSTPSFLIGVVQPDRRVKVLRHESGAIRTPVLARMLDEALEASRTASR